MGTRSITLIRKRIPRDACSATKSLLGGPDESQYIYEYYVCMYQQLDGYVEGGVGEWLAKFLCEFIREYSSMHMDAGFFTAKFVKDFMEKDKQHKFLCPLAPLEEMFQYGHQVAYIITIDATRQFFDDKSFMLSVYENCILTARPENFMEKYKQCENQIKESEISCEVVDYGDDEVEKEGYLSEDRLLAKFLKSKLMNTLF
ncbi:hypothetical protein C1645_814084 [Glomus cerebriforme]|uniref:Uncharacterized protein n=1 Tax=Glomus cerebriforme TaxID=658196 RepID=A0A397TLN1_9GLOM|nr:hypothetical protein C1645_814084 [Glomus cerebriforme]